MGWIILGIVATFCLFVVVAWYAVSNWATFSRFFKKPAGEEIIHLSAQQVLNARQNPQTLHAPVKKTLIQRLREIQPGANLVMGIETLAVIGAGTIDELTNPDGTKSWIATNNHHLPVIMLEDKSIIVCLATKHQGATQWLHLQLKDTGDRDMNVFFGDEPGYARLFANSNSANPNIEFDDLFDTTFKVVDIPEYRFAVTGEGFLQGHGRLRGVLCRSIDSSSWLLYVDNVEDEGEDGFCSNGTYVGKKINPAITIDDII